MKFKHVWIVILLIIFTTQLTAQGLGIGPQVGIYKTKDADDSSILYGAALRMKLTPSFGVEAAINYRQEKYADGLMTIKTWPIMATALFYPIPIIYGAIGAGWYNYTIDFKNNLLMKDQTDQEFGWHFGVGAELPFGPNAKLTGDIRYVFIDYNFDEVPGQEVESNFYVIMIGLLFGL